MRNPSEFCVGCMNDEYPESLQKEVAKLRDELEAATKERDEALERIKASREKEYLLALKNISSVVGDYLLFSAKSTDLNVVYLQSRKVIEREVCTDERMCVGCFTDAGCDLSEPVIPPTEAELQSQFTAAQSRIAVTEGWKLVPIEPTSMMIAQAYRRTQFSTDLGREAIAIYSAMLSAAPQPEDKP